MKSIALLLLTVFFLYLPFEGNGQTKNGWEILFDGENLHKWKSVKDKETSIKGWKIEDGILSISAEGGKGKGRDLITKDKYEDFILEMSFKLTKGANTGIKYLLNNLKDKKGRSALIGPEYQLIDDENYPGPADSKTPEGLTGALYLIYPANEKKKFAVHEWNTAKIVKKGDKVAHWLNGKKILSYKWGSSSFIDKVNKTKFIQYPDFGKMNSGHILLQDHGDLAYFKDIRIKRLK